MSHCADGELSCRAGCNACCTGLFSIGAAEALMVRSAVDALPARERETVRVAAEGIRRSTAPLFPGDPESGLFDGGDSERFMAATHAIPCPILDHDGKCRIYATRPLVCRTNGLALVLEGRVESPACLLNFGVDDIVRAVETGLSLPAVQKIERDAETALVAAGRDPSVETTIAHAIVGSAFRA
jgi:Fe-S-cluster containining protein